MKTTLRTLLFLIIILLAACKEEQGVKVPDAVLGHEAMVKLLRDMHLEEARQQAELYKQKQGDSLNLEGLFKKHNTTKAQYDSSMKFYTVHPELLDKIYDEVVSELGSDQGNLKDSVVK